MGFGLDSVISHLSRIYSYLSICLSIYLPPSLLSSSLFPHSIFSSFLSFIFLYSSHLIVSPPSLKMHLPLRYPTTPKINKQTLKCESSKIAS